jgi:hypothetical protein
MALTRVQPYMLDTASNIAFTGSNITLGSVGNLHITGGSNGQVLTTDGTGNLSFAAGAGGGSITVKIYALGLILGA